MKRIFLIFSFFVLFLYADNISILPFKNTFSGLKNANSQIKTYQDYLKFKNSLIKLSAIDPSRAFFLLGTLYMKNFNFKDKKINMNLDKALGYFYKSFDSGNNLAAYYIGLIEISKNNIYEALNVLQTGLDRTKNPTENNIYSLLAIEYSAIILDYLKNDKQSINKAIKYLSKVDASNDVAAYLFANLLYFSSASNVKKASEILNYVCNTTKSKAIIKACHTNPYIKGNKVPINCPFLKQQER